MEQPEESLIDILFHHIGDSEVWAVPFGIEFLSITKHVWILWFNSMLLILLGIFVARSILKHTLKQKLVPAGRWNLLLEIFLDFIEKDLVRPNFHGDSKKWLPFFSSLFSFILMCNLMGLFPGSATVTGNLAVTASLSLVTFLLVQVYGMTKHGVFRYWGTIVPSGIPKVLWPFIFVIEFIGLFTKPFALTIRLFANMIAGHIVILVLLYLGLQLSGNWIQLGVAPLTVLAAVAVNLLEIFIALLQAYIFSFLSAIFISAAGEGH